MVVYDKDKLWYNEDPELFWRKCPVIIKEVEESVSITEEPFPKKVHFAFF